MIVHTIHVPISANRFVAPLVSGLEREGLACSLWVPDLESQHKHFEDVRTKCRSNSIACDLVLSPFGILRNLRLLILAMREHRPFVVHAHQMRASLLPLLAACLTRVPIRIYHNHGLPYLGYGGFKRVALRLLERLNIGLSTHVIMVSPGNRQIARRDGLLHPQQGTIIGYGSAVGLKVSDWPSENFSETAQLEARKILELSEGAFIVLFVGRPVARKGFIDLIEAWRVGSYAVRGGILLCAGFTIEEVAVAGITLPDGVRCLGMQLDLRSIYAACDILCLPSWHEGMSYAILEASLSGRAIVATDIPGSRDVVLHGVTGLLTQPKCPSEIIHAMSQLECDRPLRIRMGRLGRRFVTRAFDQDFVVGQYVVWYRNLLGRYRHAESAK